MYLELQPDGLLKINPLLNWTKTDVENYIVEHHLPAHPMTVKGISQHRPRTLHNMAIWHE